LELFRRRPPAGWQNLLVHLLASLACMAAVNLTRAYVITAIMVPAGEWGRVLPAAYRDWWGPRSLMDFAIYWGIIAVARHLAIRDERLRAERDVQHLRAQLAETELSALKQQLQPHFLFNSLNAVAGLMRANQRDQAVETVAQLAGLMRSLMANSGVLLIPLARELEYIERYLAIERVRLDDRLRVRFDVAADCLRAQVPTLLMQPLVENAIKHGLARRESPGELILSAHQENGRLCIHVVNDLAEQTSTEPSPPGHGLGQRSIRARLEKHYGSDQRFTFSLQSGRAVAELDLPLQIIPSHDKPPAHPDSR
jgi:LytS/YehU family sensor histidine kinase